MPKNDHDADDKKGGKAPQAAGKEGEKPAAKGAQKGLVGKKIEHIMKNEPPKGGQKQAVAMAESMAKAGRITPSGGYRPVGKGK